MEAIKNWRKQPLLLCPNRYMNNNLYSGRWTSMAKEMRWDVLTFLSGYPSGEETVAKNKEQGYPLKEMAMGRFNSQ